LLESLCGKQAREERLRADHDCRHEKTVSPKPLDQGCGSTGNRSEAIDGTAGAPRNATGRRTENAGNSGVDEQRSAASDAVARKSAERPWNTKGKVESAFRAGTERFGAIARDSWPNCART